MTSNERVAQILLDMRAERRRQLELKAAGKFDTTAYDDALQGRFAKCSVILSEEIGEVQREICESWKGIAEERREALKRMRTELIQVMAITEAWLEGLDEKLEGLKTGKDSAK